MLWSVTMNTTGFTSRIRPEVWADHAITMLSPCYHRWITITSGESRSRLVVEAATYSYCHTVHHSRIESRSALVRGAPLVKPQPIPAVNLYGRLTSTILFIQRCVTVPLCTPAPSRWLRQAGSRATA